MPYEAYFQDESKFLAEAVHDPYLALFIRDDEKEVIAVDLGDGMQAEALCLKHDDIEAVAHRVMEDLSAKFHKVELDFKAIICVEFEYCKQMQDGNKASVLRRLEDFLNHELTQIGAGWADILGAGGVLSASIVMLLYLSKQFKNMCECEDD